MSKRITIVLDEDNEKKLRMLQAKEIQKRKASYSFSKTISDILRKNL